MRFPLVAVAAALGAASLGALAAPAHADPPASVPAAPVAPAGVATPPLEHYQLANGLEVVLQPDHHVPRVAIDVVYRVGLADNPPGRHGLASMVSRLMFDGSRHVPHRAFVSLLERAGATGVDGGVGVDQSHFWEDVPANQLALALWLESDRMAFLLDRVDAQAVEAERHALQQEYRELVVDGSVGNLPRYLVPAVYPEGHPYRAMVPSTSDINAITLADVQAFFRRYYGPGNATLVLVGDFSVPDARAQIERYFGPVRGAGRVVRPATPAVTAPAGPRELDLEASVVTDLVQYVWPTPTLFTPDDGALDLVAFVLDRSVTARLRQRLIEETHVATTVFAQQESRALGSIFVVSALAAPGHEAAELVAAIDRELDRLRTEPIGEDELENARRGTALRLLTQGEEPHDRAVQLGMFALHANEPDYWAREIANHRRVTAADFARVVRTYLDPAHRVLVRVTANPTAPYAGRLVGTHDGAQETR